MSGLQEHLELADILEIFNERTVSKIVDKRDKLWEMMKKSTTKEAQAEYDRLCAQAMFFEGMSDRFKKIISFDAVLVDKCEKLIEAYESGNSTEMVNMINKIKEVIQ